MVNKPNIIHTIPSTIIYYYAYYTYYVYIQVIDTYIKEGTISKSLDYKYIVKFYGLCVRPPQVREGSEL